MGKLGFISILVAVLAVLFGERVYNVSAVSRGYCIWCGIWLGKCVCMYVCMSGPISLQVLKSG
uniref:Uncharacterized protein n=1 Tax=Acanthochromis polyacanthus TaxID=80966 RepID=A0A3Q1G6B1_9TELE